MLYIITLMQVGYETPVHNPIASTFFINCFIFILNLCLHAGTWPTTQ